MCVLWRSCFTNSSIPEAVTLASVLRVIEGPIAPVPCLSRTAYRRCDGCRDEATCAVRLVLKDAHAASVEVLEETTLADMAARTKELSREAAPVLKYSI
jgi:DNA-binding IscR family transcriptional regulator